jgi:hypothetical protein
MARVTELDGFKPIWIWDLTDRVGWGLKNLRADVQLVQLHINKLIPKLHLLDFRHPQGSLGAGMTSYAALSPLAVDGYIGNETANAIRSYLVTRPGVKDQAIDPVYPLLSRLKGDPTNPGVIAGAQAITRRTMFNLNLDHLRTCGRLLDSSEFPQPLLADVSRRRAA